MRIGVRGVLAGMALAGFLCAGSALPANAQDETLMPEQSAAKAKQLIQAAIQAQGGNAYLNVRDVTCTAQVSQFDHGGNLSGYDKEIEYLIPPDKERDENLPKRNIITVFNGDKGWSLDRGGVSEVPAAELADHENEVKTSLDYIFRHRLQEPGMIFQYGGPDIIDLHQVDWVVLMDKDNRSIRIALSQATHLPIRQVVETTDPSTHLKGQQTYIFSNYHPISGLQTAFNVTEDRNGIKISQYFLKDCQYNTNVSPAIFTKQSLDERWAKIGKKEKKKKK
ncbi:MAG TPA: hypothetical protein VN661_08175 [Candidatus Acidoferrales bacterium]|nr:hypothetical protein [Candidatus Acidoferrales bacterium]